MIAGLFNALPANLISLSLNLVYYCGHLIFETITMICQCDVFKCVVFISSYHTD